MVSWPDFQKSYHNDKIYTRAEVDKLLEECAKAHIVNRVIKSENGRYGPNCCIAMQILAIHKTPEGTLVIVR